jgi:hypothetical protein
MLQLEKIGELAAYLARGEQINQALTLTDTLLTTLSNASTPSDIWQYGEILTRLLPVLVSYGGMSTLELFCSHLSYVLTSSEEYPQLEHFSFSWRPAIEDHEQNLNVQDWKNLLTIAVRNIAEQVIREQKSPLPDVIAFLEKQSHSIFHRITLHVLRLFANDASELITHYLTLPSEFDNLDSYHEYALLLQERFAFLSPLNQAEILSWIEEGPDVEGYKTRYRHWVGHEPSNELITSYIAQWRRDRLTWLVDALPPEWRERYEKLVTEQGVDEHPEFLSYRTMASFVGPTSPKLAEELNLLSTVELVAYLKDGQWQQANTENFSPFAPTQEGLGQELTKIIEAHPNRFADDVEQFLDLHPTYIQAILTAFERAVLQKKNFLWPSVLKLCSWVVVQSQKGQARRESEDQTATTTQGDFSWTWSCRKALHLVTEGLKEGSTEIPINFRTTVWKVLRRLTNHPEPTSEDEGRLTLSPAELAINSVRGDAMRAVISYALWVQRSLEKEEKQKKDTHVSFDEMPEVRKVLNKHLDLDYDSSLAIRAVYGQWFPWLVLLDLQWATQHVSTIFPRGEAVRHLRDAAWETYIIYCSPFDNIFPILRSEYEYAIELIGTTSNTRGHPYDPDEHLAEHLMAFYWRGKLALDEDNGLLTAFFQKASDKLRGYVFSFVGHNLHREKTSVPEHILARLQSLWEQRFQAVRSDSLHDADLDELATFGWWFSSKQFDQTWAVTQLEVVLQQNGRVEATHFIAEYLAEFSSDMPFLALKCFGIFIEKNKVRWRTSAWHEQVHKMLTDARQSTDVNAQQQVKKVAEQLLSQGYTSYFEFTR